MKIPRTKDPKIEDPEIEDNNNAIAHHVNIFTIKH
jgi:hypothetical protein